MKSPDIFLMRYITHDWADDYVKTMLRHLRDAAGPNTRLVIMDRIVPYTCPIPKDLEGAQFSGLIEPQYPPPVTIAFPDNFAFIAGVMVRQKPITLILYQHSLTIVFMNRCYSASMVKSALSSTLLTFLRPRGGRWTA